MAQKAHKTPTPKAAGPGSAPARRGRPPKATRPEAPVAPLQVAEPPAPPPAAVAPQPDPRGKLGVLVGLLRRPEGAHIAELTAATGWQPHSVRGAIAGALKRKLKLQVTSTPSEEGRLYRIVEAEAP